MPGKTHERKEQKSLFEGRELALVYMLEHATKERKRGRGTKGSF